MEVLLRQLPGSHSQSFWFKKSEVGPEMLHFPRVPRCCCCWSQDHTSRTTEFSNFTDPLAALNNPMNSSWHAIESEQWHLFWLPVNRKTTWSLLESRFSTVHLCRISGRILAATWVDLEDIVPGQPLVSQTGGQMLPDITYVWNLQKPNLGKQGVNSGYQGRGWGNGRGTV